MNPHSADNDRILRDGERVLVTGGAGFIGSNLVKTFVANGCEVTVLDNLSSGRRTNLDPLPEVRFIEEDIRNPDAVDNATQNATIIFHLAASAGNKRSVDDPISDAEINVLGTLGILEAARRHKVRKVVASSSAGIFGELKTLSIREDHPIESDTPYRSTKLCSEKPCLAYSKLYEIEVSRFRYFNVYGPNQRFDALDKAVNWAHVGRFDTNGPCDRSVLS